MNGQTTPYSWRLRQLRSRALGVLSTVTMLAIVGAACAPTTTPTLVPTSGTEWLAATVQPHPRDADRSASSAANNLSLPTAAPPPFSADTFDLRYAINVALEQNPALRAARHRWLAQVQRPTQVTLPDPMISYTFFPVSMTAGGEPMHEIEWMQRIPWPGQLDAEAAMRHAEADAARFDYEIAARNLIAEVAVAYHDLVYLDRAADIVAENQRLARQLAEIADIFTARETASPSRSTDAGTDDGMAGGMNRGGGVSRRSVKLIDALRARSQEAQLAYDRLTIAENRAVTAAMLNRLVGRAADAPIPKPLPLADVRLTVDLPALRTLTLQHRQELGRMTAMAQAAGHELDASKMMGAPEFAIGAMIGFMRRPSGAPADMTTGEVGVSVGMSLPIFGSRNQARVDEAAHRQRAVIAEGENEALDSLAMLTVAFTRYRRAERLVALYRDTLLPQAGEALAQIEALETEDATTFGEILEAQMVQLNFLLALERARSDRLQAIARLEQIVGRPLADFLERSEQPQ